MAILLGLILAVLLCWFGLWLVGAVWRLLDALVQGVVGGITYTFAIAFGTWEALRATGRWLMRTDTTFGQRLHAVWWSYSYWIKRRYIASQLRQWRRERHS